MVLVIALIGLVLAVLIPRKAIEATKSGPGNGDTATRTVMLATAADRADRKVRFSAPAAHGQQRSARAMMGSAQSW